MATDDLASHLADLADNLADLGQLEESDLGGVDESHPVTNVLGAYSEALETALAVIAAAGLTIPPTHPDR